MQREPVESSNVRSVGYDVQTKVLEVEFKNGGVYQYKDVPQETYTGLMASNSKGQFLNANIKNDYVVTKL